MALKPLDLNTLVKQVTYPLSTFMREKTRLQTNLADQKLLVLADWERMGHVVTSLVEYAKMMIDEPGAVSIETRLVRVHGDAGPAECAMISITTTDKTGGDTPADRNLFAILIGIVENHHGSVRVRSEKGRAEFSIYLPLLTDPAR